MKLPKPPTDEEKYSYFDPKPLSRLAFVWLFLSMSGILYGFVMVVKRDYITLPLLSLLLIMVPPQLVNFWLRVRKHRLTKVLHLYYVEQWRKRPHPAYSVDIFLPSCGEDLQVIYNTFTYVSQLVWGGRLTVYVLDDGASPAVERLAGMFGYRYMVRPNRGELKKAGNLIYAFDHSDGDFIVVFDADFVPRPDFLYETIPYMTQRNVGVVQTAQYFDIDLRQHWIERYAGSLQELFFRWIQPARDTYEAAICAGTNVVYRRSAVIAAGGFARTPIGEDVHSGVKLWAANYKTRYVPVILAKGLAPDTFNALTNQQYRWCRSSMLLMIDRFFRQAPFSWQQRVAFWAAFLYYMSSAALLFTSSLPTLIMLWFYPAHVHPINYLPMVPSVLATLIVFPLLARGWAPTIYRQCLVNSFCHLLALAHALRGQVAAWVPTGAAKKSVGTPQIIRRIAVVWIFLTQTFFWGGIDRDIAKYGPSQFVVTALLGCIQMYMLVPLVLVMYQKSPGAAITKVRRLTQGTVAERPSVPIKVAA